MAYLLAHPFTGPAPFASQLDPEGEAEVAAPSDPIKMLRPKHFSRGFVSLVRASLSNMNRILVARIVIAMAATSAALPA
jgi:hypothetical protein